MAHSIPGATIAILTDFGTSDPYVGVMKGVIAGIAPDALTIDITHEVAPFAISQGAFLLEQSWRWFPPNTVFLVVVDPGVGSARRPIAARAADRTFVLPDNGLLSAVSPETPEVRQIVNSAITLPRHSTTFHGRDVFAPAAAHLAAGFSFEEVGPIVDDWARLNLKSCTILHNDRFGNVVTGLRVDAFPDVRVRIGAVEIVRHAAHYAEAPEDEFFLIPGSAGYWEVSLREDSAASRLGCRVGDSLEVL